ncbi:hypothetical protein FB451DRAFT_1433240 [Mycena latifolia]|nr:hypothetical protein FB451DRAFT_1433240 [Mycena latifolia]
MTGASDTDLRRQVLDCRAKDSPVELRRRLLQRVPRGYQARSQPPAAPDMNLSAEGDADLGCRGKDDNGEFERIRSYSQCRNEDKNNTGQQQLSATSEEQFAARQARGSDPHTPLTEGSAAELAGVPIGTALAHAAPGADDENAARVPSAHVRARRRSAGGRCIVPAGVRRGERGLVAGVGREQIRSAVNTRPRRGPGGKSARTTRGDAAEFVGVPIALLLLAAALALALAGPVDGTVEAPSAKARAWRMHRAGVLTCRRAEWWRERRSRGKHATTGGGLRQTCANGLILRTAPWASSTTYRPSHVLAARTPPLARSLWRSQIGARKTQFHLQRGRAYLTRRVQLEHPASLTLGSSAMRRACAAADGRVLGASTSGKTPFANFPKSADNFQQSADGENWQEMCTISEQLLSNCCD